MTPEQEVYGLLKQHFPGRVYRTRRECEAAIEAEQQAQRAWQARRHPGDVRRDLGPLEGSADEVARATPVRWRVYDQIERLVALCRAVQRQDGVDRGLTLEEAIEGLWALQRLRDRAGCRRDATWWVARAGAPTADVMDELQQSTWVSTPKGAP